MSALRGVPVREALDSAVVALSAAGVDTPRLDAEVLLAHTLGVDRTRLVIDGPSPEHELVLQGRLAGQAPEIDPVVYLTDCDPSTLARGAFIDVEIVGSQDYDLVARPL